MLLYVELMIPVLCGGTGIAWLRVVAGRVVAERPVEVGTRIGAHILPFVEYATNPPEEKTPVRGSV